MTYTQILDPMTGKVNDKMIQRDEDGAFVPFDDANTDYQRYKEWLKQGNKPKAPPKPSKK